MATDAQSLAAQGACYLCVGASQYEMFKLTLLAQIAVAQNPSADVTPQGLINQSTCYNCYVFASMAQLMELALLDMIASSGGGGGGSGNGIITEGGDQIITEGGDSLIIE